MSLKSKIRELKDKRERALDYPYSGLRGLVAMGKEDLQAAGQGIKDVLTKLRRKKLKEDASGVSASDGVPANDAGGGNVASIGVGPQGEPPGQTSAQKKKKLRDIIKRPPPTNVVAVPNPSGSNDAE